MPEAPGMVAMMNRDQIYESVRDVLEEALGADAEEITVGSADVAELRRQRDFVAPVANGAPDEFLVPPRPVHVGGVEEVHPQLDRAVEDADRLGLIRLSIKLAHAHAPQTEGGDIQRSEFAAREVGGGHNGAPES